MSSSAAHQKAAAAAAPAAPAEEEAAEHGPFPIEQLQVWLPARHHLPALASIPPRTARFLDVRHFLLGRSLRWGTLGFFNFDTFAPEIERIRGFDGHFGPLGGGSPRWFIPIWGNFVGEFLGLPNPHARDCYLLTIPQMLSEWRFSPLIFVLALPVFLGCLRLPNSSSLIPFHWSGVDICSVEDHEYVLLLVVSSPDILSHRWVSALESEILSILFYPIRNWVSFNCMSWMQNLLHVLRQKGVHRFWRSAFHDLFFHQYNSVCNSKCM